MHGFRKAEEVGEKGKACEDHVSVFELAGVPSLCAPKLFTLILSDVEISSQTLFSAMIMTGYSSTPEDSEISWI